MHTEVMTSIPFTNLPPRRFVSCPNTCQLVSSELHNNKILSTWALGHSMNQVVILEIIEEVGAIKVM